MIRPADTFPDVTRHVLLLLSTTRFYFVMEKQDYYCRLADPAIKYHQ